MSQFDIVIDGCKLFTANPAQPVINPGALVINEGRIIWIGPKGELKAEYSENARKLLTNLEGWITPGLIDCHTHLVYGGNRADEFRRRLEGESYQQIAQSGGGILATVNATRNASEQTLYDSASKRLQAWLGDGVTHIEIKSGYGLDLENEAKMLKVAANIAENHDIGVSKTLLAAHALPPEYKNSDRYTNELQAQNAYIDYICDEIIPACKELNLVDAVDGFCESIAFNTEQISRLFTKAKAVELDVKLHAEQLSNQQGSKLAAQFNALSVDHLEYLDEESISVMADNNTVAVLLPGAYYFLGETQCPPISLLRKHNIPLAIATDANPGSSPTNSLPLMINMACTQFSLTPEEALYGVTLNAAKALGIESDKGSLEAGKQADLVCWDVEILEDLAYYFGKSSCEWVIQNGTFRIPAPTAMV